MKKTTYLALSVAVALMLSACATQQYAWKKVGVNNFDSDSSRAECRYQIKINKVPAAEQSSTFNDCMLSKGFRWTAVN
ncbi:hypothetical protein [Laribacter hongkongensis]|uniref:hypothetical protein n=1 Tax=Laribacter hongkongensis TaxID=168471 RepID=UPI001374735E|nr:hypothetical protein [Laribacter hongkongensis]MCG9040035.1 hypothetical protein [Laribacter hongkongensis]MCG9068290.1 hypothetical protein [Laribacter hongkongensis]